MFNHTGTVLIETERLILRGLTLADAPQVFKNWASDQEVAKFMRWNVHTDIKVTEEWMRACEELMGEKTRYEWGIILKETNEPIGSIGAFLNADEPNRYEIGYALGKKYWGNRYATEALQSVIDFLVNTVGIRQFICSHAKENPASGAVMGHVGFKYVKDGTYLSFDGLRKYDNRIYYLDLISPVKTLQLQNGQLVQLRGAVKGDAPELVAYLQRIGGESDFLTFGPGEFSVSVADEEAMLDRTAPNKLMLLALVENTVIGCLHFEGGGRARTQHTGEFGVSVLKDYWDQGIGTEMVQQLIYWAKATNIIRKLNLRVRSDNARALTVYQKLGFSQEGLITREFLISGQFYDFVYMGLNID